MEYLYPTYGIYLMKKMEAAIDAALWDKAVPVPEFPRGDEGGGTGQQQGGGGPAAEFFCDPCFRRIPPAILRLRFQPYLHMAYPGLLRHVAWVRAVVAQCPPQQRGGGKKQGKEQQEEQKQSFAKKAIEAVKRVWKFVKRLMRLSDKLRARLQSLKARVQVDFLFRVFVSLCDIAYDPETRTMTLKPPAEPAVYEQLMKRAKRIMLSRLPTSYRWDQQVRLTEAVREALDAYFTQKRDEGMGFVAAFAARGTLTTLAAKALERFSVWITQNMGQLLAEFDVVDPQKYAGLEPDKARKKMDFQAKMQKVRREALQAYLVHTALRGRAFFFQRVENSCLGAFAKMVGDQKRVEWVMRRLLDVQVGGDGNGTVILSNMPKDDDDDSTGVLSLILGVQLHQAFDDPNDARISSPSTKLVPGVVRALMEAALKAPFDKGRESLMQKLENFQERFEADWSRARGEKKAPPKEEGSDDGDGADGADGSGAKAAEDGSGGKDNPEGEAEAPKK